MASAPQEIIEQIAVALRFSRLERGGTNFNYPDALTPLEWASMEGLQEGRDRADSLKNQRDLEEAKRRKIKERLDGK